MPGSRSANLRGIAGREDTVRMGGRGRDDGVGMGPNVVDEVVINISFF